MKPIKTLLYIAIIAIATFTLSACAPTRNIENINAAPISAKVNINEVTKVIKTACHHRGWTTSVEKPGLIIASLRNGNRYAVQIKITYTTKSYSIHYLSSKNLNAKNGRIHYRYNRWISYLNRDIHSGLMKLRH